MFVCVCVCVCAGEREREREREREGSFIENIKYLQTTGNSTQIETAKNHCGKKLRSPLGTFINDVMQRGGGGDCIYDTRYRGVGMEASILKAFTLRSDCCEGMGVKRSYQH